MPSPPRCLCWSVTAAVTCLKVCITLEIIRYSWTNCLFAASRDINTMQMNVDPMDPSPAPSAPTKERAPAPARNPERDAAAAPVPGLVDDEDSDEEEEEDDDDEAEEEEEDLFETEADQEDPTIHDLLKEAEQAERDLAAPEAAMNKLRSYALTTYNIVRIGCASHKVSIFK